MTACKLEESCMLRQGAYGIWAEQFHQAGAALAALRRRNQGLQHTLRCRAQMRKRKYAAVSSRADASAAEVS